MHSFGPSPAATQPIHPGSYVHVGPALDAQTPLSTVTLEVWIRRWRTMGQQAIISQFDKSQACGFGLFLNEDGSLSFYMGDGGAFAEQYLHTTAPNQLKMEINPEGLKHYPDNTPSSVLSNQWHHVVAVFDGTTKQVWVDGREVGNWKTRVAARARNAPLRIGAAGHDGEAYDCRWKVSHEYPLPETARSGIYVARLKFKLDGEERLYHSVFIVKKASARPRAPIAFVCSTNSWKAYSATSFSPSWKGIKKSIGNNGFANSPGDPPAFCFYRPHRAGQGTYQHGFRMPWPVIGPYTTMGPEEWDYSHLCRQDRFTQVWLETQGYDYDVLSDTDIHCDRAALDGYQVVYVVGHSEYWSFEAMNSVRRFLGRGGSAIVLSGNTAFWRVSFNEDASVIECRKADAPGTQVRADRRGETWHSHDGKRGGMARECGFPAWTLFGLEYFSLVGVGRPGVGPYKVRNPDHFLFRRPRDLKLKDGESFCETPGRPLPQPVGHEGDVRVSTLAKFLIAPVPEGASAPTDDPAGITLLAEGFADIAQNAFAWDYFQR